MADSLILDHKDTESDTRDIHHDKREVVTEKSDIVRDENSIANDKQEIHADVKTRNTDQRIEDKAIENGNSTQPAKLDKKRVYEQHEINHDKRDLHKDSKDRVMTEKHQKPPKRIFKNDRADRNHDAANPAKTP